MYAAEQFKIQNTLIGARDLATSLATTAVSVHDLFGHRDIARGLLLLHRDRRLTTCFLCLAPNVLFLPLAPRIPLLPSQLLLPQRLVRLAAVLLLVLLHVGGIIGVVLSRLESFGDKLGLRDVGLVVSTTGWREALVGNRNVADLELFVGSPLAGGATYAAEEDQYGDPRPEENDDDDEAWDHHREVECGHDGGLGVEFEGPGGVQEAGKLLWMEHQVSCLLMTDTVAWWNPDLGVALWIWWPNGISMRKCVCLVMAVAATKCDDAGAM